MKPFDDIRYQGYHLPLTFKVSESQRISESPGILLLGRENSMYNNNNNNNNNNSGFV